MDGAAAGRLAENVARFARLLRAAGLQIGIGRTLAAVQAAACVGIASRDDLQAALAATLLDRPEQRVLFERAFALFWDRARVAETRAQLPASVLPQPKRAPRASVAGSLGSALPAGDDAAELETARVR
jgi:uncharacterized protein with von Willebrand factor type A (vWA) domain